MKLTVKQLKALIQESIHQGIDNLSHEDQLGVTEPRYDTGSPEELLIHKLYAASGLRAKFTGLAPEEVSQKLGLSNDPKIIDLIQQMMHSEFYKS